MPRRFRSYIKPAAPVQAPQPAASVTSPGTSEARSSAPEQYTTQGIQPRQRLVPRPTFTYPMNLRGGQGFFSIPPVLK